MHKRILSFSINLVLFLFVGTTAFGQSYWSVQNDNDFYFSKDYYYSNGLFLDYGKTSKLNSQNTYHFRLGQEIYNPSFRYITNTKKYDYPYSGFLYLSAKRTTTRIDNSNEIGITLGMSGEASGARQLQNWYHNTFLRLNNLAWEEAMPQKLLINMFFKHKKEWSIEDDLKFGMESAVQLGLAKTYLQHSAFLLLNGLSIIAVNNPLIQQQSGFYFGVQQQYLIHDFMIQGPLDGSNTLERELVPYRVTFIAGPVFHLKDWIIKGIWNYRSKDNSSQRHSWHPYMSVSFTKLIS